MRHASYKSPNQKAFSHYLRTGQRLPEETFVEESDVELKFNPYHDPRNGQFTFAPGGARTGPRHTPEHGHAHVPAKPRTYTVRKGDTLSHIARRHGVRTDALARANGIKHPDHIRAGQTLHIPQTPPLHPARTLQTPKTTRVFPQERDATPSNEIVVTATREQIAAARGERANSSQPLGVLSARYESGNRGARTVSSGRGDAGGVSYGLYQFTSRFPVMKNGRIVGYKIGGTVKSFLNSDEGRQWQKEFDGLIPGSKEFSAVWQDIADREGRKFAETQHQFIERTHYAPTVNGIKASKDINLDSRSDAVRNVVWSVTVQHGRARVILEKAIEQTDNVLHRDNKGYDRALINNIYNERSSYVLKNVSPKSTAQDIVANRYPRERDDALRMLAAEAYTQGN